MSENIRKEVPKQGNKMQVNSSDSFSAFTVISRAAFTLGAVILLSDLSLTRSVQAQAPSARPLMQAPVRAHKKAHARSDSSSLTVIGLLAGGAALMAAGGHSGPPSEASMPQSPSIQPQIVLTGSIPYASSVNDGGTGSVNGVPAVASFTAATIGNGAASTVLITQRIAPTVTATEATAPPSLVQTDPTAPTQETALVGPQSSLPPAPSVPEPSASITLAVGSLSLVGLLMRGRRLRS